MSADVVRRRVEHHRKNLMVADFALQTVDQLFLRQSALLEEALHERVIALGDFLDERRAHLVRLALHVRRDVGSFELSRSVGRVDVRLHRDQIDDAFEILFFADRKLDRNDVLAELFLQRLERAGEGGALAIQLVDDDQPR